MNIENRSPLQIGCVVLLDKRGAERMTVSLKATYLFDVESRLLLASRQDPLRSAEEFYGEPGLSSIRYESEIGPAKVATDVVLVGTAVAPSPATRVMDVSFRVGPIQKRLRVHGTRRWRGALGIYSASDPEPFDRLPLTYENAFGGKDISAKDTKHHGHEPANPVGRGFMARTSLAKPGEMVLPNIESPDDPITRPGKRVVPQGFGFIGRDWHPRVTFAGTYDQQWSEERRPLLPLDFDDRYHNAAHPDLIANGFLSGDEMVEVIGCTSSRRLSFALPGIRPTARLISEAGSENLSLNLNTLLVDTDAMKVSLLWKAEVDVHKRLLKLLRLECHAPGAK